MPDFVDAFLAWPHARDTLGLAGMVLLALPALAAVHASRQLGEFECRELGPRVDARLRQGRQRLVARMKSRLTRWSPVHAACLYAGYGLLLASYLVGFLTQG